MKIAFIGVGNMGGAIIKGMCYNNFTPADIAAYDINTEKLNEMAVEWGIIPAATAEEAIADAGVVVMAVKPQMFATVIPPLKEAIRQSGALLISIAAGKTLASIADLVGETTPIVRAMPNICAVVGASVSAYTGNGLVTSEHKEVVESIFNAVGTTTEIDEKLFAAFGAIASCSPAFSAMYVNALATAGVKHGIPKAKALEIASGAVMGAALFLQETGTHPAVMMDGVCSPGGTTIEGVCSLQQDGFEAAVVAAVDATMEKDKKL